MVKLATAQAFCIAEERITSGWICSSQTEWPGVHLTAELKTRGLKEAEKCNSVFFNFNWSKRKMQPLFGSDTFHITGSFHLRETLQPLSRRVSKAQARKYRVYDGLGVIFFFFLKEESVVWKVQGSAKWESCMWMCLWKRLLPNLLHTPGCLMEHNRVIRNISEFNPRAWPGANKT